MSKQTIVVNTFCHGEEMSYSVSWFDPATGLARGWRPAKRVTGRIFRPTRVERLAFAREVLMLIAQDL